MKRKVLFIMMNNLGAPRSKPVGARRKDQGAFLTGEQPNSNRKGFMFLESAHDDDRELPVGRDADVVWVDRKNAGEALMEAVSSSAFDASIISAWSPATT